MLVNSTDCEAPWIRFEWSAHIFECLMNDIAIYWRFSPICLFPFRNSLVEDVEISRSQHISSANEHPLHSQNGVPCSGHNWAKLKIIFVSFYKIINTTGTHKPNSFYFWDVDEWKRRESMRSTSKHLYVNRRRIPIYSTGRKHKAWVIIRVISVYSHIRRTYHFICSSFLYAFTSQTKGSERNTNTHTNAIPKKKKKKKKNVLNVRILHICCVFDEPKNMTFIRSTRRASNMNTNTKSTCAL